MIFKKTINFLKVLFIKQGPDKKFNDNMKSLLRKLDDKAVMLENQLKTEKDEKKRKDITLMLKVISKKQKKGEKIMKEREMKLGTSGFSKSGTHKMIIKPELSPRI